MDTLVCRKCKVEKELSKFSFEKDIQQYRKTRKECRNIQMRPKRLENIDNIRISRKKAYDKHKDKILFRLQARKFNLTYEELDLLYKSQENKCAICGQLSRTSRRLAVDHDHKTGKIRGLLCGLCNAAIGHFEERSDWLENAIQYLKEHENDN